MSQTMRVHAVRYRCLPYSVMMTDPCPERTGSEVNNDASIDRGWTPRKTTRSFHEGYETQKMTQAQRRKQRGHT